MNPPSSSAPREQSTGEEIANSISHGAGLMAAVAAAPFLILRAVKGGSAALMVGTAVFAASVIVLYLVSTLYHALPEGRGKRAFLVFDHSAIFLLIAGTYTPFMLGVVRGVLGWTVLAVIWSLALAGVTMKTMDRLAHPVVSTGLYLLMGWLIVVTAGPLHSAVSESGLRCLLAGGISYTAGVAFFASGPRLRYRHFIWHLFVLTGTACHYCAVFSIAGG